MRAILTYHSIDGSGSPTSRPLEAFERHLAWLASGPRRVASLGDLMRLPAGEDAVALSLAGAPRALTP